MGKTFRRSKSYDDYSYDDYRDSYNKKHVSIRNRMNRKQRLSNKTYIPVSSKDLEQDSSYIYQNENVS